MFTDRYGFAIISEEKSRTGRKEDKKPCRDGIKIYLNPVPKAKVM
jgi:hypothetical protein